VDRLFCCCSCCGGSGEARLPPDSLSLAVGTLGEPSNLPASCLPSGLTAALRSTAAGANGVKLGGAGILLLLLLLNSLSNTLGLRRGGCLPAWPRLVLDAVAPTTAAGSRGGLSAAAAAARPQRACRRPGFTPLPLPALFLRPVWA
jgi:hypothetical protein